MNVRSIFSEKASKDRLFKAFPTSQIFFFFEAAMPPAAGWPSQGRAGRGGGGREGGQDGHGPSPGAARAPARPAAPSSQGSLAPPRSLVLKTFTCTDGGAHGGPAFTPRCRPGAGEVLG